MAEEYQIDKAQRTVWSRCWGVLTDDDLLGHQLRLKADPEFDPGFHQLIDTTGVTQVDLTSGTVRQVAQNTIFSRESKRAFVVKKDIIFGLGRMFELYHSIKGTRTVGVFRTRAEAAAWLGVTDAAPDPLPRD